ncbi:MAG: site-specific integrase [Clostridiales bacterium]|jgi:hypothetical protein|nr:site-specific integrase [Clostridiales bacterium]
MLFWTKEGYQNFITCISHKPQSKMAFEVFYWTGLRIGEFILLPYLILIINFINKTITINKSIQRIDNKINKINSSKIQLEPK